MGAFDLSSCRIVTDKTVELPMSTLYADIPLPRSVADGVLLVAYVGEYNRDYQNAAVRVQAPRLEAFRRTSKPWSSMTEEERTQRLRQMEDEDRIRREVARDLFPGRAIKGWSRMRNADCSESIPYSDEKAGELLDELCAPGQEYMFDRLKAFCSDISRFVAGALPVESMSGN